MRWHCIKDWIIYNRIIGVKSRDGAVETMQVRWSNYVLLWGSVIMFRLLFDERKSDLQYEAMNCQLTCHCTAAEEEQLIS